MPYITIQTKSIFASTTFWGSVVSLVAMLFPHIFANIAGDYPQTTVVSMIVAIIGFITTVYGRFTAVQPVSLKAELKVVDTKFTPIPRAGG
jgi:predicted fused transcriptional regulator/phosphomethylpyrimidine kinase